jgi:hypothetical protein
MLMLAPAALLARRAIAERHPGSPRRSGRCDCSAGCARRGSWRERHSGCRADRHVRPAVARRLREGGPPAFPPARADALLLGGTVFALLAREEGERAAVAAAREGPAHLLQCGSAAAACAAPRTRGAPTWRAWPSQARHPGGDAAEGLLDA